LLFCDAVETQPSMRAYPMKIVTGGEEPSPLLAVGGEPVLHIRGRDHRVSPSWPIMMHSALRDEDSVLHDHDFLEIAFVLSGSGTHFSQSGAASAGAGDVFIVRPGSWHVYRDCRRLAVQNCCFDPDMLARDLACAAQNSLVDYLFSQGPLAKERSGVMHLHLPSMELRACRRHLTDMFSADAEQSRLRWTGHFLLLTEQLIARLNPDEVSQAGQARRVHPAVREGTRLLNEKLAHGWTLCELAECLHLNPSYLVRLFKNGTGLAPLSYLARRRAEEAAGLLVRTDLTVAEIGARVGWRDPSYFSQRFKAHYGLSAGAYRARFGPHAARLDS